MKEKYIYEKYPESEVLKNEK
jgi:hypothetical protein